MRGLRSFILLIVIAAGLGWYVYHDANREPASDAEKKEKVFTVEPDKIEEMTVRSEAGEQTRLQKTGDKGWQIVAPAAAAPDPAEVSGLTSNLASLEMQRVIDENSSNLQEYGLAKPRIEVSFKSGGQSQALLIGQKTPPGTDVYAKRAADNRVFTIPSHLESTFNRGTFDLRDKTVLKVDRDKLDVLDITAGDRTAKFTKAAGGEWQLAAPAPGRADYNAIESLVGRLAGLQMKAVVETADAQKTGLDKPVATVRLGTGSSQATLALGGVAAEGTVYARDLSRPGVFTVESSLLDDLKKDPSEYRQKDLFDARGFNATRIDIVRAGQTHTFEKSRVKNKDGQDEERWKQTAPQARDLDGPTFDTLLSALTTTRAASFVDAAAAAKALASPELAVTVKFDDGKKEERVTFARAGADAYAARAGETGAAKIDSSALDAIVKALQELK